MPAQAGGTGRDGGFGVSVTSDGGAIVTGEFGGTATFGSTKMTSNGELDVFVGKISAAGVWEWATQAGGTGLIDGGGVSVTSDGGAIVSGVFAGTATVGSATLTSNGRKNDVFVGKISATGVWEWATQAGGTGLDGGFGVSATSDGGAIVTGEFGVTATFGSTILTSNGARDAFLGKISAAGEWEWVTQAGGTGQDGGFGVSVTSDGGAIVTGQFGGTATFGSATLTSNGAKDVFVGKISAAGEWEWVTQVGGTGLDGGFGVSVTSDGGAIVTGEFGGTATFGSATLTSNGSKNDVFVGKISATGVWEWATQAGGTGLDGGFGVSVTSDGGAIVTGGFRDMATFGSATLTGNVELDVFVGKISAAGEWEWVTQAGGTGWDVGFDVSVTSDDGAIVAGYFSGTARFGSTKMTSNGARDAFLGKISAAGVWGS